MTTPENDYTSADDAVLDDIRVRKERIQQELAEIECAENAYATWKAYVPKAIERVRQNAVALSLSQDDVRGQTQRSILYLLADRNDGWLVVDQAIRAMTEARVFTADTNASAQVYTLLGQKQGIRPPFDRIHPGLYRCRPLAYVEPSQVLEERPQATKRPGLTQKVATVLAEHPSWTRRQTADELVREGWDFHEKQPIFAVGMAYAGIAKQHKREAMKKTPTASLQFDLPAESQASSAVASASRPIFRRVG